MTTTVININDCADQNARLRLETRCASLIGTPASFAATTNDLEAAGLLIEALDATEYAHHPSVILANIAPRNGAAKKHKNGTPFCYFTTRTTLVVATIDGYMLSLIKKFGLTEVVHVLDTEEVLGVLAKDQYITDAQAARIARTQFRSYEFSPRVAAYLRAHKTLPSQERSLADIPDAPHAVWYIDNFGNCKTTLLESDIKENPKTIQTKWGSLPFYPRLKDVPDGECAVVVGSSGYQEKRFLEIVGQGVSAANTLGITLTESLT